MNTLFYHYDSQYESNINLDWIAIYLFIIDVGWFARRTACSNTRTITITEGTQGIINLKTVVGLAKQVEKTITLGEEHTELLPNGQETKVSMHIIISGKFEYFIDLYSIITSIWYEKNFLTLNYRV